MIDGILIGLVVLYAVHFVAIMVYAGIGISFTFIWLFLAALPLFLVCGKQYYARNLDRIPGRVPVSVVTICVTGAVVLAILCVLVFLDTATSAKNSLDYVVVLGVRVRERTVSNFLRKRPDKAMEYVEDNPNMILMLLGSKGPGEDTNEAEVMYQYLVYNSVKPEQLLIRDHSESTVENIAYSKVIIKQHRKKNQKVLVPPRQKTTSVPYAVASDRPLKIGVFTSNLHIYRARTTAEEWGSNNAHGISADSDPVPFIHLCIRECASTAEDRLMGNM